MQNAVVREYASRHTHFIAGGAACCFSTNSASILAAARQTFLPAEGSFCGGGFQADIIVTDPENRPSRFWSTPYFRGLEHMVVASFGPHDTLFFNQMTKQVHGRVSPPMARDSELWQNTILPMMVGTMGPVCGVTPLHCACLVKNGEGILLAGRSGTGKSTLTYALARMGFEFLSDDWTYFSREQGEVAAWGLPIPAKLLPDTAQFFPELGGHQPVPWLNGETAFSADPVLLSGAQRSLQCTPRRIFILERCEGPNAEFIPLAWEKTLQWFETGVQQLPASLSRHRTEQLRTIQLLAERECWILRFSGSPEHVARALASFCDGTGRKSNAKPTAPRRMDARVPDNLRRLTPTPLQCDLRVADEIISLETNSSVLLKAVRDLAATTGESLPLLPERVRWRLVAESNDLCKAESSAGRLHGNTGGDCKDSTKNDLPCVSFPDGSFLAFDRQNRMGIGFLSRSALQAKFVQASLLTAMTTLMRSTDRTTEAA